MISCRDHVGGREGGRERGMVVVVVVVVVGVVGGVVGGGSYLLRVSVCDAASPWPTTPSPRP